LGIIFDAVINVTELVVKVIEKALPLDKSIDAV
jgi:hypothetical protein